MGQAREGSRGPHAGRESSLPRASRWLLAGVGGAALFLIACGGNDPDRVVGVLIRCDANGTTVRVDMSGPDCTGNVRNIRQVLTVRTSDGKTYTAEVPISPTIQLGQQWP